MADLKLTFLNSKLSKEQLQMAEKVAKAAAAMGVDPSLAVSIAFKEGSLNPNAPDSPKKAIGMMQVLASTGQAYGYSEEDLRDPDKNLDAGIKNIKEALQYSNNNPKLAALYYHSGPDAIADLATDKPLGPNAKEYLQSLKNFGTFEAFDPSFKASTEPAEAPAASLADATPLTTEQDFIRANSGADLRRQEYGAIGGASGVGVAMAPYAGRTAATTAGKLMKAFNEAKQPAPMAPTGGLPMGGAPVPPQAPPNAPMGAPTGGLPQGQPSGGPGYMTRNYGTAAGLTEIEAGRALDNTKQAGGVHDLLSQRREAMNKIQSMGGNNFVENPRFGGIMTQAPSVGGGPRESFAMRTLDVGQPAEFSPIPRAPYIPTTPPPPSGLDQVKNLFTGMMNQGMRLMPVIGPPLAGYSIGRDLADIQTQYERAPMDRDYTDIGLSGASALAAGASLFPPAFPVAAPLSIGIPTFRNIRRNVLAQESDPELQRINKMEPTAQELEAASRPYVGYPRIR
jgi:hypothetical protein